ncbi:major capsid protein [Spartinivicinus marinus]|nr:major capsid protein [Spartinivicinus marinus]MCX4025172.1 major capsid protein [Spartinivicinus marinus]
MERYTDTMQLVQTIETKKKPLPFYLSRYYSTTHEFETETIEFELLFRDRHLAPFVSPMVEGQVMEEQGSEMKSFKPAYIKPKQPIIPQAMLKRRPGEPYHGQLSPQQRRNLRKMEILLEHAESIDNRLEWMAVEASLHGRVMVEGEKYPKRVVDYQRDPSLTKTVSVKWNDPKATPIDDLEDMSVAMSMTKGGAPAEDVVMSPSVWKALRKNQQLLEQLDTQVAGTNATIDRGPLNNSDEVIKVGSLGGGRFILYVDSRQYMEKGISKPFIPEGGVNLMSRSVQGTQCFGAIMDLDALIAMKLFPKIWKQDDPSVEMVMTQSAPLIVPVRPNATALLTVL